MGKGVSARMRPESVPQKGVKYGNYKRPIRRTGQAVRKAYRFSMSVGNVLPTGFWAANWRQDALDRLG